MAKENEEDKASQDNYERSIPAWLPGQLNQTMKEISSTDTSITGTISSLSTLVKELYQRPETETNIKIVNEIREIKNKLSELETNIT